MNLWPIRSFSLGNNNSCCISSLSQWTSEAGGDSWSWVWMAALDGARTVLSYGRVMGGAGTELVCIGICTSFMKDKLLKCNWPALYNKMTSWKWEPFKHIPLKEQTLNYLEWKKLELATSMSMYVHGGNGKLLVRALFEIVFSGLAYVCHIACA